jgi:TetR/AcrR family transcriptional regulator
MTKQTSGAPRQGGKAVAVDSSKPVRRLRDKEVTRAAILDAALQIFAEESFEGATTRDIAARAGVNHAMIKYYFENKNELWKAAVVFLFERMRLELVMSPADMEALHGEEARAYAKAYWSTYVRYCARHPEHARLMIQETIRDGKRLDWAAEHLLQESQRRAEFMVRWMQDRGLVPMVSPSALLFIIVGASQLYYALAPEVRRTWGHDPCQENHVEEHVDALMAVLFG